MIAKLLLPHAKALIAAAISFLGALQVGLDGGLTAQEVVGSLVAGLVALGGVYAAPNLGYEKAQDVVDAVRAELPTEVADLVEMAVAPAGGVLRTVKG